MTYPNFKNKHLHEALFNPNDYVNYKKWNRKKFPKKYIITYQSEIKSYFFELVWLRPHKQKQKGGRPEDPRKNNFL